MNMWMIRNRVTGEFRTHTNSYSMPALYRTEKVAAQYLKKYWMYDPERTRNVEGKRHYQITDWLHPDGTWGSQPPKGKTYADYQIPNPDWEVIEVSLTPVEYPDECHPSHVTRSSDASAFDEVCVNCGARDVAGGGWGTLRRPCKNEKGGPKPSR